MLTQPETLKAIQDGKCTHWNAECLRDVNLKDGDYNAVRAFLRRDRKTGMDILQPALPWLLKDIFSIQACSIKLARRPLKPLVANY